jgi:phosphate transport system substrate-binding protein
MRLLACMALGSALLFSSTARAEEKFDGTLRVAGSTTLLPVVADAASQFMERYGTWDKVAPGLPARKVLIFVTGGGSGFGVKAAIDGTAQIGMCSRPLKAVEKQKLGTHEEILLSRDALAFAVNAQNPLARKQSLTRQDVVRIFSGEAKTFKDLDPSLPDKPILVQMRDAAGGSTEMVKELILKEKGFSPAAIQVPSQGANLRKLESNPNAVGYVSSVMALQSEGLKVFSYEGVAPTNENVIRGLYPVVRPLLLIVKGMPGPAARKFIEFLLGEGQKIVVEHGYVPVKAQL